MDWTEDKLNLLGKITDVEFCTKFNCDRKTVERKRKSLDISRMINNWSEEKEANFRLGILKCSVCLCKKELICFNNRKNKNSYTGKSSSCKKI